MVVAFAKDHASSSNLDQSELERQVRAGDLSAVLQEYENDIKKPGKNSWDYQTVLLIAQCYFLYTQFAHWLVAP